MEEESEKHYFAQRKDRVPPNRDRDFAQRKDRVPPKFFRKKQYEYKRQMGWRNARPTKAWQDHKKVAYYPKVSKVLDAKDSTKSQSSRKSPNSHLPEVPKKTINIYYSEHNDVAAWAAQKKKNALEFNQYIQLNKDIPVDYIKNICEWLESPASPPSDIGPTDVEESPPENLGKESSLLNSSDIDSNDEEVVARGKNPFAQDCVDESSLGQDQDRSNQEEQIDAFNKRLQLHVAVPESCLTDAIFKMDRPHDAVVLGEKLPPMSFENICTVGASIQISVTEVYGPFHFWFNFQNHIHDASILRDMNSNIVYFYQSKAGYDSPLTPYFLKEGYICAARKDNTWRRARIVATPPPKSDIVPVYYVDFGYGEDVSLKNLKFLPSSFANVPALAFRGSLSHIHPLGLHWPPDTISHFRQLVEDREIQAIVDEVDSVNGILFMRLAHNNGFAPSLNRLLVEAGLAGRSYHFSKDAINYNGGRRIRYLRERLPTFEMLESRLIPMNDEEFEAFFDEMVYAPSFHSSYEVPKMQNPFHAGLREALVAWMPSYQEEQELWIKKYQDSPKEADQKRKTDMEEAEKKGTKMEEAEKKLSKVEKPEKEGTKMEEAEKNGIKMEEAEKNGIKTEEAEKKGIKKEKADKKLTKVEEAGKEGTKMEEAQHERKEVVEQKKREERKAQGKERELPQKTRRDVLEKTKKQDTQAQEIKKNEREDQTKNKEMKANPRKKWGWAKKEKY